MVGGTGDRNQWPLPCETGVRGLRINDMRAETPIATGTWYHVMSFDITQHHELSVPELSQTMFTIPLGGLPTTTCLSVSGSLPSVQETEQAAPNDP
jgi:hypothetical protein